MLFHPNYLSLSSNAKVLILYLQEIWAPNRQVISFGVREAMRVLSCGDTAARNALDQLQEGKFIILMSESNFVGRLSRDWRLTWMAKKGEQPTGEWEK